MVLPRLRVGLVYPVPSMPFRYPLSGRSGGEAAPALSHKPHREALAGAVDPVTARSSKVIAPTQEGGPRSDPRKPKR